MKRSAPLKRSSTLKRGKPLRRTAFKRSKRKARPTDDPVHLALIRSLPCHRCNKPGPNEPHHPRDFTGMGKRAPDRDAFPLCDRCHRAWLHDSGVPREERRAFQREAVTHYRKFADYPVLLLVRVANTERWEVFWLLVDAFATDEEAERGWAMGRGVAASGAWWGPREEAVKMLADPNYEPKEARSA